MRLKYRSGFTRRRAGRVAGSVFYLQHLSRDRDLRYLTITHTTGLGWWWGLGQGEDGDHGTWVMSGENYPTFNKCLLALRAELKKNYGAEV